MLSSILMDAFQDSDTSIPIRYRFDDKLFNLRRMQAKTKMQTDVLHVDELLCADDQRQNFKGPWIKFHNDLIIAIIFQSAQQRQVLYSSQHLENRTINQLSL